MEEAKSESGEIKDKLPNYLLKLEKYFGEWEKDIGRINTSVKNMEKMGGKTSNVCIRSVPKDEDFTLSLPKGEIIMFTLWAFLDEKGCDWERWKGNWRVYKIINIE